jgi:dipeptidase E
MHVYLSSFLLGDKADALLSLVRNPKAVVIANAIDNVREVREEHLHEQLTGLRRLGLDAEELDLRECFRDARRLALRMSAVGLVWVTGGNAFLLRRAMRYSGFDQYISDRTGEDLLVYGGYSAGACVAGPTLRGVDLVDMTLATADGYDSDVVWDGLGLVPYSIVPHYRSPHRDSTGADAMVEYYIENKMPFVALRDGETVITTTV